MAILGGSAEEHLARFLNILKGYIPELESYRIRWFDTFEIVWKDGIYLLKRSSLRNLDLLPAKLNELSDRGKSWINIYGEGKITANVYLLAIAYNLKSEGAPATSINASGPCLNFDGSPKMDTRIKIIH